MDFLVFGEGFDGKREEASPTVRRHWATISVWIILAGPRAGELVIVKQKGSVMFDQIKRKA